MKPLVIFGAGDIAQLAHYYFSTDSDREIIAFTVDANFIRSETLCGLPVVAFDEVANRFPPDRYDMFIALSYSNINKTRREKYYAAKATGYTLASYVSSRATMLSEGLIGDNCFILEDNTIQPFVTIGSNVTMWSGNHIGHHSTIGDHCFIASHAVISGGVTVGEACFVGVNATLRDHIVIGANCVIGAGALVMANAEPNSVFIGQATTKASIASDDLHTI